MTGDLRTRVEALRDEIDNGRHLDMAEMSEVLTALLDAGPDTPTACETCGDAGWFTADPSDPEFCECAAGKRLMAANNADPDTPTADAPVDTDLREQIARLLTDALDLSLPSADEARDLADALLPLVRAQVEAARRDALNEAADEIAAWRRPRTTATVAEWLREQAAARGETRQP